MKWLIGIAIGIAGLVGIANISVDSTNTNQPRTETQQTRPTKSIEVDSDVSVKKDNAPLSNDSYYTNVNGNKVHSPAKSLNGNIPAGASARCKDGTYSFSQNRRGTCSHHGGVAQWY